MDLYFNIWIFDLIIIAGSFNIITWSVRGLNHPVKRKKALTHLRNLSAGIAFIQETHFKNSDNARLKCGWVGQLFHSTFQGRARGVAILIKKESPSHLP